MQAIILAGGFGTRLASVVDSVPKPLAPVAGKPFLSWLLRYMRRQGVTEAVLCVHHQADTVMRHFGSSHAGITLHYSIEEKPLGTGGAIRHALYALNPDKPVFVLNGDSLVELDYRRMYAQHLFQPSRLTLAVAHASDCSRYSQLTLRDGQVTRYATLGDASAGQISVGFYVASPDLFDGFTLPETFSFERDFLSAHTPSLLPAAYEDVHYFIDIGVPKDYIRAQEEIPERMDIRLAA